MRIHWALYDPAFVSGGNSYWTWSDPELPHAKLETFYYDFASKNLSPNPNALTKQDIWGGVCRMADGWTACYRFLDGGRDRQGRPGRFVILTAWAAPAEPSHMLDYAALLRSRFFGMIADIAKTAIPVPTPDTLSSEWPVDAARRDTTDAKRDIGATEKAFTGESALEEALALFSSLSLDRPAQVVIRQGAGMAEAVVKQVPPPKPAVMHTSQVASRNASPMPEARPRPAARTVPPRKELSGLQKMLLTWPKASLLCAAVGGAVVFYSISLLVGAPKSREASSPQPQAIRSDGSNSGAITLDKNGQSSPIFPLGSVSGTESREKESDGAESKQEPNKLSGPSQ